VSRFSWWLVRLVQNSESRCPEKDFHLVRQLTDDILVSRGFNPGISEQTQPRAKQFFYQSDATAWRVKQTF
jgi:hypothetical protein